MAKAAHHLGAKPAVPRGFGSLGLLQSPWPLIGCWLCHCNCNGLIFDYRLYRETRTLCPVGRAALSPWACHRRYWVRCYRSSRETPRRCKKVFVQCHRSASYKKPRIQNAMPMPHASRPGCFHGVGQETGGPKTSWIEGRTKLLAPDHY